MIFKVKGSLTAKHEATRSSITQYSKSVRGVPPIICNRAESCIPEWERVHQALVELIERNEPYNLEFEIITKDTRQRRTIMSHAELEGDSTGPPTRIRGVVQDIAARRKVEKALLESEEKHRLIFE